ncbi:flagellar biosynthesis regulator FlaF [Rhodoblastus acidophilus]|uniref:Flagellar biosynthesis regulator FlaF n=1 Tax=Candidatus Rhodoblastus alkanivorans TaxID=2954117 RepID=A0ABS9Z3E8_9HYPH|nr:flagellar biosynthesis regulator FlaF [Candidatus Rhodoblastus alkanivorans]MCI4678794.1 flagellar biosynthesis regulator FlaF [Candidatus Rhodoblastus alkanivorans]MCI4682183.1 flagellar biosynthesis regulator FlaF [Candidatus Rhodoblastus alkanivorans]MDI4639485.1 flagellar biosynthesis regulator FlaF [Rhodoblastus acidophilus]
MYQFTYAEVVDDSPQDMRERERDALARCIDMLEAAEKAGPQSAEARDALTFLRRLWSIFIEDLSSEGNDLPRDLRVQLISIGIWTLKEIERLRSGAKQSFGDLIEINAIIRDGLA